MRHAIVNFDSEQKQFDSKQYSASKSNAECLLIVVTGSLESKHAQSYAINSYLNPGIIASQKVILQSILPLSHKSCKYFPYFDTLEQLDVYTQLVENHHQECHERFSLYSNLIYEKFGKEANIESVISYGDRGESIVDYSKKFDPYLIIIGDERMGFFESIFEGTFFVGHIGEYCKQKASCEVRVISPF
jgi:hypothetical protein